MEIDKIYFDKLPKTLLTEDEALKLAIEKQNNFKEFTVALLGQSECRKKIYQAWLFRRQRNKPITKLAEDYGASNVTKEELKNTINTNLTAAYTADRAQEPIEKIISLILSAKLSTALYEAVYNASSFEESIATKLANLYKKYIDSRNLLVTANLRLVPKFAAQFGHLGIAMLDLIQDGNSGLIRAVEKYDPNTGIKISSYASWWIKQAIRRSIKNSKRTIWLPHHIHDNLSRIKNFKSEFVNKFKREPNILEIEMATGIARSKIEKAVEATALPISLETSINTHSKEKLKDIIEDEDSHKIPDQLIEAKNLRNAIQEVLDPREQDIIKARFALDQTEETRDQLSKRLGLSKERIRQLEVEALMKLKTRLS